MDNPVSISSLVALLNTESIREAQERVIMSVPNYPIEDDQDFPGQSYSRSEYLEDCE